MMKKKKILMIAGVAVLIAVVTVSVFMGQRDNTTGITKYQWIQMLAEQFGMSEPASQTSYFEDVGSNSPYYSYVQSAYEWGVLEDSSLFEGEKAADGEFVALTAMKAIGEYKVQIYLGLSDVPSDKEYLDLALEKEDYQ